LAGPAPGRGDDQLRPFPVLEPQRGLAVEEVGPVVITHDPQGLAHLARPVGEVATAGTAPSGHVLAFDDLPTADEDPPPHALGPGRGVGAVVDAVGAIDVEGARTLEHRPVPLRQPPIGVGRRVLGSLVRLHLRDPHPHDLPADGGDQVTAEEEGRRLFGWPGQDLLETGDPHAPRKVAPAAAAASIIACRTAATSSPVSVRSGALSRSRMAMARSPSGPRNSSKTQEDSRRSPPASLVTRSNSPARASGATRNERSKSTCGYTEGVNPGTGATGASSGS